MRSLSNRIPAVELTTIFMNKVYLWMTLGVVITGLVAYETAHYLPLLMTYLRYKPYGANLFMTSFYSLLGLQLIEVILFSLFLKKMNALTAIFLYLLYSITVGLSLSLIFFVYSQQDISSAFFISAFIFGALSAYGYYTKRDLAFFGTFCTMGLFGLIGFLLYAIFFPSSMNNSSQLFITAAGIIIFSGLTAFDTQKIKNLALESSLDEKQLAKAAIFGALTLYLDFINLFLMLLRSRR